MAARSCLFWARVDANWCWAMTSLAWSRRWGPTCCTSHPATGSGASGQLAIQWLSRWGARVTAVCGGASAARCLALGATQVVDRGTTRLSDLPSDCDATLNFGTWADDADVLGRLHAGALGHATTVHPLLGHIDDRGWLTGGR